MTYIMECKFSCHVDENKHFMEYKHGNLLTCIPIRSIERPRSYY